jgi:DNA-binding beta-propeller fold protein YncE
VAVDAFGSLFVADTSNQVIKKVFPNSTMVVVAGNNGAVGGVDGTGTLATLARPSRMSISTNALYFIETSDYFPGSNVRVRRLSFLDQSVALIAGQNSATAGFLTGIGLSAVFGNIYDIILSPQGDKLYVLDSFGVYMLTF